MQSTPSVNPRNLFLTAMFVVLMAALTLPASSQNANPNTDAAVQNSTLSGYVNVELQGMPLATYDGSEPGFAATKPARGKRLNLNSNAAAAYAKHLANKRAQFESWLAANMPKASVVQELSVVQNMVAVNIDGYDSSALLKAPFVARVSSVNMYHPSMDISPGLINAPVLWAKVGGQSNAGAGIKIGIIDAGIDNTHSFLTDNSLTPPTGFPKCDARDAAVCSSLTSNKVIVAKVFQIHTNFDATAKQDHGTHVSGTAAGKNGTSAPFVPAGSMSGIAPKAFLGNYNVFPGNTVSAPDFRIAAAVEAAVSDGMDVLNLSLGGTPRGPSDALIAAVNNAVDAGVVVAIAAGNSGPGAGTVESPGIAEKVITAAATTNPHFLGVPVKEQNSPSATFAAAVGAGPSFGAPSIAALAVAGGDGRACAALPAGSLTGKIALIARGACTFSAKNNNAAAAGAVGMIVTNNVVGDPIAMGAVTPFTIPGVMVGIADRSALVAYANGTNQVSVNGSSPQEFVTTNADILAGFSSRGPAVFTLGIKPDVAGPGVNVYSSVLSTSCASPPCFAFFQGTSMATPHVTGSSAVLRQLHPDWSVEQIKSALVNTAKRPVFNSFGTTLTEDVNPMDRGGGRIDLDGAANTPATLDPVSVSFGLLNGNGPISKTQAVAVQNVSTGSLSCTVASSQDSGGATIISTGSSALNVSLGGSGTVTVSLNADKSVASGDYFGDVTVSCSGSPMLHIPWWARISRNP